MGFVFFFLSAPSDVYKPFCEQLPYGIDDGILDF